MASGQSMMRWLRVLLRLPAPPPHYRPNQLRQDLVRAERLRREAMRASLAAPAEEEAQGARREPSPAAPKPRPRPSLGAPLTRQELRRAIVLGEIIGPPLSLRDAGTPPDLRH